MFAGKFRSWMEAHLGRPKKNKQQKDKAKGASRGHAVDTAPADRASPQGPAPLTDLPASSHLHRGPLTAESLDSISTCPTTGSERGGLRPHVNLSSPESAYSTGYSTDGTSPGTSFPPEYYINLRTGTHYFHSLGAPPGLPPGLPLPPGGLHSGLHNALHSGLPHPGTLPLHLPPGLPPLPPALQPALQPHLNSRQTWGWPTGLVQQPDPPRLSYLTPGRSRKQQHQQQQHQQLLLEQQQQHLHLLQQQQHQHQQLLQQQQQMYHKQQQKQQQCYIHALSRTESSTEEDLVGKAARPSSTSSSTISSQSATSSARHWQPADCVSSPRARTRIRTNPWLPTSPAPTPNATPTPRTRSQQQQQQQHQQTAPQPAGRQGLGGCSSSLSLSSSSSYGSASDVSLQRRPGSVGAAVPGAVPGAAGRSRARGGARGAARPQPLFQLNEESPSVEDKPLPRMQPTPSQRPAAPPVANGNTAVVSNGRSSRTSSRAPLRSASSSSRGAAKSRPPGRSSSCSGSSTSSASSRTANNGSPPNLSDNETEDVEDVTLNEMMGKFDESYVYEKETDILSDSDPTDVEDYGDDGGDEQTEEDDGAEMDFIDRGSITDICDDHQLVNRGHCTFHNFPPGRRQSSRRRAARREVSRDSASSRDASVGSPRGGTRTPSDRRRRRSAPRQQSQDSGVVVPDVNVPNVNLNRIVMQRLLLRSAELGTGLGTRSAGNTPLSARRNQRAPPPPPAPHSRVADYALADADREADRKYRQLIMQAEHILVSMTTTPTGTPTGSPLPLRTPHYGTPPMSKRHVMPNLNRRLDYLKQGAPCGPPQGPYGPCPGGPASHCTSPLARDRRFNDNAEENRNRWSPLVMPRRALEDPDLRRKQCFTPSPSDFRRDSAIALDPPPPAPGPPMDIRASPLLSSFQRRPCPDGASPGSTPGGRRRGPPPVPPPRTVTAPAPASPNPVQAVVPTPAPPPAAPRLCKTFQLNLQTLPLPPPPAHSAVTKGWTAIEASSSDSDGSMTPRPTRAVLPLALDRRAKSTATTPTSSRPPLVTYKSVDHRLDMLDACPQSEPVKRKVYADSHTLDRLSKKLEHTEIMPRTPTTPTPLLDNEDTHRKNMLMETLQQLKQSLESQSASLQAPS